MRFLLIIFIATVLIAVPAVHAQTATTGTTATVSTGTSQNTQAPTVSPAAKIVVWVNTATGVYHYPGTRWYGNTKHGKYMNEDDAIKEGDRPALNGQ
jgi:maltose-binding protein MalE